jgi:hypothetical protein
MLVAMLMRKPGLWEGDGHKQFSGRRGWGEVRPCPTGGVTYTGVVLFWPLSLDAGV